MPRSRWLGAALMLPLLVAIGVLLWWRGPDWGVVYHAFDLVNWVFSFFRRLFFACHRGSPDLIFRRNA